jgi:two-component system sensor histidine kinase RegB
MVGGIAKSELQARPDASPDAAQMGTPEAPPSGPEALTVRLERLSRAPAPDLALPSVVQLRFVLLTGEALLLMLSDDARFPSAFFFGAVSAISLQVLSNGWLLLPTATRRDHPQHVLGAALALDILAFTAVLVATGGVMNPFSLSYLVLITLSAVLLHQTWTWGLGALATLCYGALFWLPGGELQGNLHGGMHSGMHNGMHGDAAMPGVFSQHLSGMWLAFVFAAATITFFMARVSATLRRREGEVLTLQREVANQERVTSIAALAAGAAHEINTPLGTIAIAAREIERCADTADGGTLADARLIRDEVERCRRIVERMSLRGGELAGESPVPTTLGAILENALAELPTPERSRVVASVKDPALALLLPPQAAAKALAAILQNAIQASDAAQPVRLNAQVTGGLAEFRVHNACAPLDPRVLARITEPFFTTKPAGEGMGLGAYLARLFALRMGGDLRYESLPGDGVTAILTLCSEEPRQW